MAERIMLHQTEQCIIYLKVESVIIPEHITHMHSLVTILINIPEVQ